MTNDNCQMTKDFDIWILAFEILFLWHLDFAI